MRNITSFLEQLNRWLWHEDSIMGVLLVVSFARGTARDDSDVDLVLITPSMQVYLDNDDWISIFGTPAQITLEDWGPLQSRRVFYTDGLEVEFGFTSPQWASIAPVDAGTRQVIQDGAQILLDRTGLLQNLVSAIQDNP